VLIGIKVILSQQMSTNTSRDVPMSPGMEHDPSVRGANPDWAPLMGISWYISQQRTVAKGSMGAGSVQRTIAATIQTDEHQWDQGAPISAEELPISRYLVCNVMDYYNAEDRWPGVWCAFLCAAMSKRDGVMRTSPPVCWMMRVAAFRVKFISGEVQNWTQYLYRET